VNAIKLSERQITCLQLIAEGRTSAEIGRRLGLSSRTVDHYVSHACARLGVRTRAQAVVRAIAMGIIVLPGLAGDPSGQPHAPQ
jgi:DNA-binding CsgD family transcriptional regulator